METPVLRFAERGDAAALSALAETTFTETFGDLFADAPEDLRAHLDGGFGLAATRAFLDRDDVRVVLAYVSDELVGYVKLVGGADDLELQRMYLTQASLGRGIAAPLMGAALAYARRIGAANLRLSVYEHNLRAQAFYRKHGFSVYGSESYAIGSKTFAFDLMRVVL